MLSAPDAFVPDKVHIKIMREVAVRPNCSVNHIVSQLFPGINESVIRSGVRNLLSAKYLDLDSTMSPPGIHLRLTPSGREVLLRTGIPVPIHFGSRPQGQKIPLNIQNLSP